MKKRINRRSMRKSVKFKPDSAFISNAVSEYLANGGKITRTVFDEKSFKNFTSTNEHPGAVDEFLKDQ